MAQNHSAMGKHFYNPNLGKSPLDPSYDESFNEEEEYERYLEALADKEEEERGN